MTLKEIRLATGMTQEQFAEYTGINVGTLRGYEYGKTTPQDYIVELIAYKLKHEGLLKS